MGPIYFLLWHNLSLFCCFVLLLEESQFLSRINWLMFVNWNIHTASIFLFKFLLFRWFLSLLFLDAIISLPLPFFMYAWSRLIQTSAIAYYYYYYYYYLLIRLFHISVSWWFFTGVWVTASPLKSLGFFTVFWPFSVRLSFGWSLLFWQIPSHPGPWIML